VIYEAVAPDAPIQQGDIFRSIPRVDISLLQMTVLVKENDEEEARELAWTDALLNPGAADKSNGGCISGILPIHPVHAVVITQSCDALRAEAISLCEIAPMSQVMGNAIQPGSKKWVTTLTRQSTENLRWFYLPPAESIGFADKMAADFRLVISVQRTDLETLRSLRVGRLNFVAYEHFREKLAEFFRRYPVNAWYPLSKQELETYAKESGPVEPYDWQK
jgi:hypothetical protein